MTEASVRADLRRNGYGELDDYRAELPWITRAIIWCLRLATGNLKEKKQ